MRHDLCYNDGNRRLVRRAVMLSDGIYEQVINSKIQAQLEKLDPEQFKILTDPMQADDSRHLLTIYLSHVIEKGLHYIRDSYKSEEDQEALLAQIRLCNDIVEEIALHAQEAAPQGQQTGFEDDQILEKGQILTSIYHKINDTKALTDKEAVRPQTSIVENVLFTGSHNEPSMMSELKKEILTADRIDFLVSFIKWSAIRPLLQELRQFTSRDDFEKEPDQVRLRIITTTYTKATDFKAVEELAKLPHTQVKVNYETSHARLHAKSYLFHRDTNFSTAYIGSSNLSNPALTGGLEWNVKVTEQESFDIVKKFEVSFESYWNDPIFEFFDPSDEDCRRHLREELDKGIDDPLKNFHLESVIRPYAYQQEILDNLQAERQLHGRYKNLIVAATGVGKTLIAAFDYKRFKDSHNRANLLFVAHRKEILEQSIRKFREVLNDFSFGQLYVDGKKPDDLHHLFISIQSFNAADLTALTSDDFYDFIIVDEFHHAAARSYQKLLSYYHPKILLGLTATPDRMDGKDILSYFDGKVASTMLLGEAIDRNLLSTFQYFGVTDSVDYSKIKWTRGKYDVRELETAYLTADKQRAGLILNNVFTYTADINEVKGLGFCVSVRHADYMAQYFSQHGVPSLALSAESSSQERESAKDKLVRGEVKFIFTVDLYNEGVDIKEVNTILFLRPTESATVFMQQLGRGLRLCPGKDCLTVLDFIGQSNRHYNYRKKFSALAGPGRKPLKDQLKDGFSNLPRGCYIQLEKQAKEYILENLKQLGNQKNRLIEQVRTFEEDTGKKLTLHNFLTEYDLTLYDFYQKKGDRSLYRLKNWAEGRTDFQDVDDSVYSLLTGLFHINSVTLLDYWIRYIEGDKVPSDDRERLMRNMLYYTFYKKHPRKMGFSSIDEGIDSVLKESFVKEEVLEILRYNKDHIHFVAQKNEYPYTCPLQIGCDYNTNQIMAAYGLFDETHSPEFREGVKYFEDKKTDIFLINLNKSEKDFSPSTMYEDYAISPTLFHWQSQSQDRPESSKIQRYIHHKVTGNIISLFVREFKKIAANSQYTAPFTFLGNADYMSHQGSQPVSFVWKLHQPMPADLLPKANKTIAM